MRRAGNRSRRPASVSAWPAWRRWMVRGGLCGLLAALCLVGYQWVPSAVAGLMTVRHVSIAGTARLDRQDILALLNVSGESSLLLLDRSRLEKQVEAHPWVASASVGRALPHTLSVIVVERKRAAVVRDADGDVFVDDEGVVLTPVSDAPTGYLPTLVGLSAAKLLEGDRATQARVRPALDFAECLHRRFGRAVTVDLGDARFLSGHTDTHVVLANHDFRQAWQQYLNLESVLPEGHHRRPHEIDLRFVGQLIVRQKG